MADEARVTQEVVELMDGQPVPMRITQDIVELLDGQPIPVRMAQFLVEIIYQEGPPPPPPIPEPGPNPIPTIIPATRQWKLYRCDNKPRGEQTG